MQLKPFETAAMVLALPLRTAWLLLFFVPSFFSFFLSSVFVLSCVPCFFIFFILCICVCVSSFFLLFCFVCVSSVFVFCFCVCPLLLFVCVCVCVCVCMCVSPLFLCVCVSSVFVFCLESWKCCPSGERPEDAEPRETNLAGLLSSAGREASTRLNWALTISGVRLTTVDSSSHWLLSTHTHIHK